MLSDLLIEVALHLQGRLRLAGRCRRPQSPTPSCCLRRLAPCVLCYQLHSRVRCRSLFGLRQESPPPTRVRRIQGSYKAASFISPVRTQPSESFPKLLPPFQYAEALWRLTTPCLHFRHPPRSFLQVVLLDRRRDSLPPACWTRWVLGRGNERLRLAD